MNNKIVAYVAVGALVAGAFALGLVVGPNTGPAAWDSSDMTAYLAKLRPQALHQSASGATQVVLWDGGGNGGGGWGAPMEVSCGGGADFVSLPMETGEDYMVFPWDVGNYLLKCGLYVERSPDVQRVGEFSGCVDVRW